MGSKPRPRYVYIVEMLDEKQRWQPTVGVALVLVDARAEVALWRARNSAKFRIARYEHMAPRKG
jgi:hypothetical protein